MTFLTFDLQINNMRGSRRQQRLPLEEADRQNRLHQADDSLYRLKEGLSQEHERD
jgi:hypothetical protein